MQQPDFAQQAGGGAHFTITPNPDGTFTVSAGMPGVPDVTAATEREAVMQMMNQIQTMMGQGQQMGQGAGQMNPQMQGQQMQGPPQGGPPQMPPQMPPQQMPGRPPMQGRPPGM